MAKVHPLVDIYPSRKFAVWSPITLRSAAVRVLLTEDVHEKAQLTFRYVDAWKQSVISTVDEDESGLLRCEHDEPPEKPVRPSYLGSNSKWCNKKTSVLNTIHGIAHAESYAIELFWDAIARFTHYKLPVEFYDNMVEIAGQEASHFLAWSDRLEELGCSYGSLATHEGLWRDAEKTSHSLLARLAIINMLHEARGLDVFPLTMKKLEKSNDKRSMAILERNFKEEIFHVATGLKWFKFLIFNRSEYNDSAENEFSHSCPKNCISSFHHIVTKYHGGALKREALNVEARAQAGMTLEWYDSLCRP